LKQAMLKISFYFFSICRISFEYYSAFRLLSAKSHHQASFLSRS
jgi:hypothetical protein